jgi:hypothetical protein
MNETLNTTILASSAILNLGIAKPERQGAKRDEIMAGCAASFRTLAYMFPWTAI